MKKTLWLRLFSLGLLLAGGLFSITSFAGSSQVETPITALDPYP